MALPNFNNSHQSLLMHGDIAGPQTIANLLQYLNRTLANGCLDIDHMTHGKARVYFEQGRLVHASVVQLTGVEAISRILALKRGTFNFLEGVQSEVQSIRLNLDNLLLKVQQKPSLSPIQLSDVLHISSEKKADHTVSVSLRAITVLRYLDGKKTLDVLRQELNIPADTMVSIANELVAKNFAYLQNIPHGYVNEQLLETLEHICAVAVGPLAPLVLSDALEDLGYQRDAIPLQDVSVLMGAVKTHIPREAHAKFSQQVQKSLREFHPKA